MKSLPRTILHWVYLINASVLITHEIDSAYWHEWELFGIPGGIQVFLVINLILVVIIIFGYQALISGKTTGYVLAWVLAGSGFFAFSIHSYFLLLGDPAFRLLVSIALLFATLLLSVLQVIILMKLKCGFSSVDKITF